MPCWHVNDPPGWRQLMTNDMQMPLQWQTFDRYACVCSSEGCRVCYSCTTCLASLAVCWYDDGHICQGIKMTGMCMCVSVCFLNRCTNTWSKNTMLCDPHRVWAITETTRTAAVVWCKNVSLDRLHQSNIIVIRLISAISLKGLYWFWCLHQI